MQDSESDSGSPHSVMVKLRPQGQFTGRPHTMKIIMMLRVSQHGAGAKLENHIQLRLPTEATGSPGYWGNEIKMTMSENKE